jgi:hypothetical protein
MYNRMTPWALLEEKGFAEDGERGAYYVSEDGAVSPA